MEKAKIGRIKWYRHDGTGYLIGEENPNKSILFDISAIKSKKKSEISAIQKGQCVEYRSINVMGKEIAVYVKPVRDSLN